MTKGEYRVGISFNPSNNTAVDKVKRDAADLIDYIEAWFQHNRPADGDDQIEVIRLVALAQTHIEDAAMWAVKAITKPPRS